MQPCNRMYYSTVHWRLNMFRAAYRSSSGASGLHTHVVTSRSQVWVGTGQLPLRLDYGRSPHAHVNQRLQIQLELLMMSGMPLETCWAFNERWNNKFYYKVASCWLFLLRVLNKIVILTAARASCERGFNRMELVQCDLSSLLHYSLNGMPVMTANCPPNDISQSWQPLPLLVLFKLKSAPREGTEVPFVSCM